MAGRPRTSCLWQATGCSQSPRDWGGAGRAESQAAGSYIRIAECALPDLERDLKLGRGPAGTNSPGIFAGSEEDRDVR